jgi:hypothetical protein
MNTIINEEEENKNKRARSEALIKAQQKYFLKNKEKIYNYRKERYNPEKYKQYMEKYLTPEKRHQLHKLNYSTEKRRQQYEPLKIERAIYSQFRKLFK